MTKEQPSVHYKVQPEKPRRPKDTPAGPWSWSRPRTKGDAVDLKTWRPSWGRRDIVKSVDATAVPSAVDLAVRSIDIASAEEAKSLPVPEAADPISAALASLEAIHKAG